MVGPWLGLSTFTAECPRARVRSLVGELRSNKSCGMAKNKIELNIWYDKPYSQIGRFSLVKTSIVSKFTWFTTISLHVDINKIILRFTWKSKETRISKATSKRKNKLGIINLPNIKAIHSYSNQNFVCR